MKMTPRSWIFGGMAVAALALGLAWRLGWMGKPKQVAKKGGVVILVANGSAPTNHNQASLPAGQTNRVWPETPVDLGVAESNFTRIVESQPRDPFQITEVVVPVSPTYSPVSLLKLRAIWRQSGSRAVVINGRVYVEGDTVEGFQIDRIDGDRVWLKGPEKIEQLVFDRGERPVATPAPVRKGAGPGKGLFGAPIGTGNKSKL